MKTLTTEEVRSRQMLSWRTRVPMATQRWHEGSELVGYWAEGDSFVFKSNGHYLCVSRHFIELIASGQVNFDEVAA